MESQLFAFPAARLIEFGKSQRLKMQRVKTSDNFAEEKMFAEDISEDFSDITFTEF